MKIGILTMPLHINYGGILQAYALKTVLERMGHEVWVINEPYHREKLQLKKYWLTCLKRFYLRNQGSLQLWRDWIHIGTRRMKNSMNCLTHW